MNNSSENGIPDFAWCIAAGITYIILGVTSLSLNCLVFGLIWSDKAFKVTTYYVLVRQLLVADGMLAIVVGILHGVAVIEQSRLGDIVSRISCFLSVYAWFYAMTLYVLIAVNRVIAIVFAKHKIRAFISLRATYVQIGAAVCYNLLLAIYFTFPKPALVNFHQILTIYWDAINVKSAKIGYLFNVISNGASIGIQWICSAIILLKVWKVKRKIGTALSLSSKIVHQNLETNVVNQQQQQHHNDWKKQVSLFTQFFCASILLTILSLCFFTFPHHAQRLRLSDFLILHVCWIFIHGVNPILYLIFNKEIQRCFLNQWRRITNLSGANGT